MVKESCGRSSRGRCQWSGLGLASVALALGTSCGLLAVPTHPIYAGMVETEGVTIRAADGSFTLQSGQSFETPFTGRCYSLSQREFDALRPENLVEGTAIGQARGAHRVDVLVPGRDRPLFGLLLLCDVPNSASGPASRSYRITVPQEYVDAAAGGRISAVYERVNFTGGQVGWWYGWVLWLSDAPY